MLKIDKVTASLWREVRRLQQQVSQTIGAVWGSIEGSLDNQTDLKNALDSKANASDVLTKTNTVSYTPTSDYHPATKKYVDDNAGGGGSPVWGSITGILSNQTDLQNALNSKASTSHNHPKSDITDFAHTHTISDTTGLQTAIDGKANSTHTHIISDTTGLQTALDGKANTSHTHSISDVSGLQTELNNKVDLLSNQTIGGIKTFSSFPVTPSSAPVNDYDVANKKYVDDKTAGGSGGQSLVKGNIHSNAIALTNSYVDIISKTLTITAGNTIQGEIHGRIFNNSGATRTYTAKIDVGGVILAIVASTTIATASYTNFWARFTVSVISSTLTIFAGVLAPLAATTAGASGTVTFRHAWNTSSSNLTGNQVVKLSILSSGTGAQNFSGAGIITQIPSI